MEDVAAERQSRRSRFTRFLRNRVGGPIVTRVRSARRHRETGCPVSLDQLPIGSVAEIIGLGGDPADARNVLVTQRLKELGFVPGNTIRIIAFGLLGRGSIAVAINGTKFALRRAEASMVMTGPVTAVTHRR